MLNTLIDPPPASAPRVLETAPLFVHTLWRTGGTYVWNKLRRGAFWAYHEPFHELLLTARPDQLEAQFQDNFSGRLRHPETERQYFHEFPAAPTGGVPFFAKSFSYDDYWLPETHAHPALRHYLQHLLSHAADQGRRPAAKFCRSALRLGWLRQNFPAAHWGLLRAPRAQWESYLSFAGKYFTTATLLVAGKTAHAPVMQPLQAALPVPRLDAETVAEELQAYAHLLPHFELDQQYFVFYYLWLAFLMETAAATDLILDLDLIQADAGARQALEARCAEVFAAPLDFADIHLPAYSQLSQPAEELQRVEAAVLACFSRELGDSYRARLTRFDPAAAPLSSAYRRLIDSVLAGRPLPAPPAFSFPAGPRPVD
ncbi:MAG: hypothetical protein JNK29_01520, partial [Anaerolineales bacterium]|nr:hypothetical protein [Anaerolineales bacterium]